MGRVHNFNAGPGILPEEVLQEAADGLLDWRGSGQSVMEMSHRGKEYAAIHDRAESDLRELFGIPDTHAVLFLQGGASLQFEMVPMNLLGANRRADHVVSGEWSKKAVAAARLQGDVHVAASSEDRRFSYFPPQSAWSLRQDAAYAHLCANETIGGVEMHWTPDTGDVPLVADMSSNLLSKPVDVARYGLIYAGAQKNVGPAGLTLVIIRRDLVGRGVPTPTTMLDYRTHALSRSLHNTPPTWSIHVAGLVFAWLLKGGGLAAMERRNVEKAALLYDYLDGSSFYANPVAPADRSRMNVPFTLQDASLEKAFLDGAREQGMIGLEGHRSVGGLRASLYNAMPRAGVEALVGFMREFEARHH